MSVTTPGFDGWVLLPPEMVPKRWRHRAVTITLVPLLPSEAQQILTTESATPDIDPEDEAVLRLAGRGLSSQAIARELKVTPRSVQRRLARLRDRLGVDARADLPAVLSSRGFTEGEDE